MEAYEYQGNPVDMLEFEEDRPLVLHLGGEVSALEDPYKGTILDKFREMMHQPDVSDQPQNIEIVEGFTTTIRRDDEGAVHLAVLGLPPVDERAWENARFDIHTTTYRIAFVQHKEWVIPVTEQNRLTYAFTIIATVGRYVEMENTNRLTGALRVGAPKDSNIEYFVGTAGKNPAKITWDAKGIFEV